ncbi:MAG TPA: 4-alpha-glucanotransferase [Rhabdochlamydiaceae bacterium]|jgi:4-alpha-glucanotransferase
MDDLKEQLLSSSSAHLWKRIGIHPHHGICVFLPSLHSAKSSGIGEFYDLLPLIEWCHQLKMDVIQLPPLNNADHDPSPYNPMSACGMNFLLLSLHALPFMEDLPELRKRLANLAHLNQPLRVAYDDVLVHKTSWLQAYFDAVGKTLMREKDFLRFVQANSWVEYFAIFRALKDHLGNTPYLSWPEDLKSPSQETYQHLLRTNAAKVAFYTTMQYLCYLQLKKVKEYAQSKGVLLKGDIPILVGCESAEAWHYPQYFETQLIAGSPPDMYYSEGQYWGFPIFRWDALRQDDFSWWKTRLKYASEFFDLFRIDHVIGFFRIWAITPHTSPKSGRYIPAKKEQWEKQGRELLHMMINFSGGMMPIAEDLGTVPDILPVVLREMGICGTKVIRWQRYYQEDKHFIPFAYYDPLSMTCVSTHDSETLAQWWTLCPEEAKPFAQFKQWDYTPELKTEQRYEMLWDAHHTPSLFHINLLQEYLALFPELVWPQLDTERINRPGTVSPENWTYRYRPSVEELVAHDGLFDAMQKIVSSTSLLL